MTNTFVAAPKVFPMFCLFFIYSLAVLKRNLKPGERDPRYQSFVSTTLLDTLRKRQEPRTFVAYGGGGDIFCAKDLSAAEVRIWFVVVQVSMS